MTFGEGLKYTRGFVPKFFSNLENFRDKAIYFTGDGAPYAIEDLLLLLPDSIEAADLEMDAPDQYANPETAFLIVGYEGYDEGEITRYVDEMGSLAAFLPQEGFVDLLFGYDWWHTTGVNSYLDRYLDHHDGLRYVKSLEKEDFQWPSTEATRVVGTSEGKSDHEYVEFTALRAAGYSIYHGSRRYTDNERLNILVRILSQGKVSLKEIAETIAFLCTRSKGQGRNYQAIENYEHDLAWLKKNYFDPGTNRFQWPTT